MNLFYHSFSGIFKKPLFVLVAAIFTISACSTTRKTTDREKEREELRGIEQESVLQLLHAEEQDSVPSAKPAEPRVTNGNLSVDALLDSLTLREKIGQLFFVYASGYFTSEDNSSYLDLVDKVTRHKVGGLIFMNGEVYGQAILTNKLQNLSKFPLWITQDMEYGAAMRVSRTTRLTPAMGIAATGNPEYAYWAGKITAREAKALGVHQIFAPVLDVNNNPDNPVINVRSFSGDPEIVTGFASEFIRGVHSEGLISTAKHFPGHGDTDIDSHLSLPVISYDYQRLDSLELVPFRNAIKQGVGSIMTAHIAFPKISSNPALPGTMDESIVKRILVDSLQFDGMIVTDGLEMNGIASRFSPGRAVVEALKAGSDLMLLSPDELTAMNELEQAVHRGEISEARIDRSVRKLLTWKKDRRLFENRAVNLSELSTHINTRQHETIADEIARKSVTLVKNRGNILPIRPSDFPRILVVSVADDESGNTGSYFARQVRNYHPDVQFHVFDKRSSEQDKEAILRAADRADLILIGSFIYVRSHKPIQLTPDQTGFLNRLIQKNKKTVLVAFGNPYIVRDLKNTDVQVMGWAANSEQVRNTVPALFGASPITGKMPIRIPGLYEIGDGIRLPQTTVRPDRPEAAGLMSDSLRRVERIMNQAIEDSTFPGGVVTVLKDGIIVYQKAFGYHTYDKTRKVEENDVYDLASLTKVVATTSAVMKLIDEGKLGLDEKVSKYIPEFKTGKKNDITIRNLLVHNSGLPPFRVYVDSIRQRSQIIHAIKNEPLIAEPGTEYIYSDLGFILLAEIVEKVSGERLDRYVRNKLFYTMGMSSTFFNPSKVGGWMERRIPPTEIDTVYGRGLVRGRVHDERAYFMDGVAGHAGLFSSGSDLAAYAQWLLNEGSYGGKNYISPETVWLFTEYRSKTGNRALGFDRKGTGFSTAGTLSGPNTFGHLGFTGTSLWIDPDRNLAIIILTNRTYPNRSYGRNMSRIRSEVADAVISSIAE